MRCRYFYFIPFLILFFFACTKEGCTDVKADNYSDEAEVDDGSCSFANGPYAYVANSQYKIEGAVKTTSGNGIPNASVNVYWKHDGESTVIAELKTNGLGDISYYGESNQLYQLGVQNYDTFVAGTFSSSGSGADTTEFVPGNNLIKFDDIVVQ